MIYKAIYTFTNKTFRRGRCQDGSLQYEADDDADALESFKRWYKDRQDCVPDYFGELLSVSLYLCIFGRITSEGKTDDNREIRKITVE